MNTKQERSKESWKGLHGDCRGAHPPGNMLLDAKMMKSVDEFVMGLQEK
jgi:hypothetical protein